ncbi:MAG: Ig-like domain-containing domain [Paludibacter sp.]|nr:Ig-like domain-containing domain [Paludibacter sp.]
MINTRFIKKIKYFAACFACGVVIYSCANKAQGPTGGPKDEIPPKVLRSTPANEALNYKKKEIQIIFDENISIDNASENVLISPPQSTQPDVRGNARVVTINFDEDLLDSTTYTINFGDAIVDLNEKNPLKNYRFSFSTGNEIDTLKLSGTVLNAEDLNPVAKAYVGIYKEHDDSVFLKKPFLRVARTDEYGRFVVDNVKAGTYRIYALGDANKDYFYQPGEALAFTDSLYTPSVIKTEMRDTVWKDSIHVDSVRTYMGNKYLPDNIVLRYFKENKKRLYFVKSERKNPESFSLFFSANQDSLPDIKPLNFDWEGKYIVQKNNANDSLTYWLTDSTVYKTDTLVMAMTYMKTDSVFNLVPQTDTISVYSRKAKANNPKGKKSKGPEPVKTYKFSTNLSSSFDVYNPVTFKFDAPLDSVNLAGVALSEKIDSILKPLKFKWTQVDSTKLSYAIEYQWEPEKSYTLHVDSATFFSIYGITNDKFEGVFKLKSLEEYSSIKLFAETFDSLLVFQVIDIKDAVVATKPALKEGTLFEYLRPGEYFMRAFKDVNRNGIWDTGDFSNKIQPEEVYYNPKKLTLRANWEFEERWNVNSQPLLQQKPAELKKDNSKKQGR